MELLAERGIDVSYRTVLRRPGCRCAAAGTARHASLSCSWRRRSAVQASKSALTELVRRMPNMHLIDAWPAWRPILGLRGLQALHVAS
jgi:hypothetical protein